MRTWGLTTGARTDIWDHYKIVKWERLRLQELGLRLGTDLPSPSLECWCQRSRLVGASAAQERDNGGSYHDDNEHTAQS